MWCRWWKMLIAQPLLLGIPLLLLDRYFLTVPALEKLEIPQRQRDVHMEIVTKAKSPVPHLKGQAANPEGDGLPKKERLST